MTASQRIDVSDPSHVAEVRRIATALASAAGMGAARCSDAGIVATELATNLLKHAREGIVLINSADRGGVELVAIDRGEGISNTARAMRDGYSTAGSPGNGLGAIARLASTMDMYTQPRLGTVVFARMGVEPGRQADHPAGPAISQPPFGLATIRVAVRGETVCGDGVATRCGPDGFWIALADGLGHGPLAAAASQAALDAFAMRRAVSVTGTLSDLHDALRSTRGAALAIAHVHPHQKTVKYAGIGNIVGAVVGEGAVRRMVSHNGTAGLGSPKIAEFTYPWERSASLIMHSDGLTAKWDLDAYPGLASRHPMVIAAVLFRDFAREKDDATIVVAREAAA